jgi:hypothetical protein
MGHQTVATSSLVQKRRCSQAHSDGVFSLSVWFSRCAPCMTNPSDTGMTAVCNNDNLEFVSCACFTSPSMDAMMWKGNNSGLTKQCLPGRLE